MEEITVGFWMCYVGIKVSTAPENISRVDKCDGPSHVCFWVSPRKSRIGNHSSVALGQTDLIPTRERRSLSQQAVLLL